MRKRKNGGEWMKRQWDMLWMAALCLLLAACAAAGGPEG